VVVNSFGMYGAPGMYGGGFGGPVVASGGGGGGLITILILGVMAAFLYTTIAGGNDGGPMDGECTQPYSSGYTNVSQCQGGGGHHQDQPNANDESLMGIQC